jgi:hypothetical protein
MAQDYIDEDNSVPPGEFLTDDLPPSLEITYALHPDNFKSNKGQRYWIDPTRGPVTRFMHETGIMPDPYYRYMKYRIKNLFNRLRGD